MVLGNSSNYMMPYMYRFRKLLEYGVDPYVMVYNQLNDIRLRKFARWVNGRIYKSEDARNFEHYGPWMKARDKYWATMELDRIQLKLAF